MNIKQSQFLTPKINKNNTNKNTKHAQNEIQFTQI
jgi:3-deoxy-D-manno-octulosonic acid (KDO) 8-phosphate synthase